VTTGIDMALAMLEDDHGRAVADRVAAQLVLYVRRPGFQSQFTEALLAQMQTGDPLGDIIARARSRLRSLDVPRLAKLAGLSGRTLHRRCREHLRITPAKLVERLRVEHARTLLSTTERSLKTIAHESGFSSAERMRRAFERELGVRPRDVRVLFGSRRAA
jgi:transcriptional regulator GlxA family with amidase domain